MIFAERRRATSGATRIWRSRRNPLAPARRRDVVHHPAAACSRSRRRASPRHSPAPSAAAFLAELFPKLVALPRVAVPRARPRRARARHAHPPVGVRPRHDATVDARDRAGCRSRGGRAPRPRLHLARVLRFLRRDTQLRADRAAPDRRRRLADARARPARGQAVRLRAAATCRADRSVLIEDVAFNSMLVAANRALESIAGELRRADRPTRCASASIARDARSTSCGTTTTGQYCSRDAVTGTLLRLADHRHVPAAVRPASRRRRATRCSSTGSANRAAFWPRFPVPSVPTDAPAVPRASGTGRARRG